VHHLIFANDEHRPKIIATLHRAITLVPMAKKKIIRDMRQPPGLELKAASIAELKKLARRRKRPLIWYHEVGTILHKEVPVAKGKKPRGVIRNIAEACFGDVKLASTLYGCRQFARVIKEDEVLGEMKNLTWAPAHYLMSVRTKSERKKLIKQSENLTARQVRLLIQEKFERQKTKAGRELKATALKPPMALRETARMCREWLALCKPWLESAASVKVKKTNETDFWRASKEDVGTALKDLQLAVVEAGKLWPAPPEKKTNHRPLGPIGKSRPIKQSEPRSRSRAIGRKKFR